MEGENMECPQEQIMAIGQTPPIVSEPKMFHENKIDTDSNEIAKPTSQSIVWLAGMVATTSMKTKRIPTKRPRLDVTNAEQILQIIAAHGTS